MTNTSLEPLDNGNYLYRLENDIDYKDRDLYSITQLLENKQINKTEFHDNYNGTFDGYAHLENDGKYILTNKETKTLFDIENGKIIIKKSFNH